MWDTLIKFWNMGIQSFLIFGDNCRFFLKDMGYFLKKLMVYGILEPPLPGPLFFNFLFFLNGIIQFKRQVLFRINFLSVTSDCRVQCPRVGLEVKI